MNFGKVAVLMGGKLRRARDLADERQRRARRRCARRASTRTPSIRRSATCSTSSAKASRAVHRAARPLRRGRHAAGRARDARHSLHRQRRDGLGDRHGQVCAPSWSGSRAGCRRRGSECSTKRPTGPRSRSELGLPLIVKPANEGSTLGMTKVRIGEASCPRPTRWRRSTTRLVIAEQFVDGPEYTAAMLGDEALPLIRIEAPEGNYDYQNKYFTDDTQVPLSRRRCRRRRRRSCRRCRCARSARSAAAAGAAST